MSVLCAFWARDGRQRPSDMVSKMEAAVDAFVPGARGARWADAQAALAILKMDTQPEDRFDREPEGRDGVAIAADIFLDNRDELAGALELDPREAGQVADSGLLRLAWRQWGPACVSHLGGEFAFIIWDQGRQTLFAARDRFGLRPLCFGGVGRAIAIATLPKAILALPGISDAPDEAQITARLGLRREARSRTFFREIAMLPPAHTLIATSDRIDVSKYWEWRPSEIRYRRDQDYVDRFRELFERAVRRRLRSSTPVGSLLSAGLDSGSVTAIAARELARRNEALIAATWTPRPAALMPPMRARVLDEAEGARGVAALYPNIDHRLIEAPDGSALAAIAHLGDRMDQPFRNTRQAPLFLATGEVLRAAGCRVLLHGQSGNYGISYTGVTLLSSLLRRGRPLRAMREGIALGRQPGQPALDLLYLALQPFMPRAIARQVAAIRASRPARGHAFSALNPSAAAGEPHGRASDVSTIGTAVDDPRLRLPEGRYVDLGPIWKGLQLALGAELRDPTMDIDLLEYCLAIPDDQFLRLGQSRWLIRRAMRGILPDATLQEPFRGYQGADWPRFVAPYRGECAALLDAMERSQMAARLMDLPALRQRIDAWPTEWTPALVEPYCGTLLGGLGVGRFILQHTEPGMTW
jgi:asparagine synthase (glutamine-hydrolysing)